MWFKEIYHELYRILLVVILKIRKRGGVFPIIWGVKYLHINSLDNSINILTDKLEKVSVFLYGSGHQLLIERDVIFKKGMIWFEDKNCSIVIREKTTIEEAEISAAEDGMHIAIEKDCMLSSGIRISTTDSHSIISLDTNKRINEAGSVLIENHVWIGHNATICKGIHIGHDTIIGTNSVVTHDIPPSVVAAGVPARIVKSNVTWNRKRI